MRLFTTAQFFGAMHLETLLDGILQRSCAPGANSVLNNKTQQRR